MPPRRSGRGMPLRRPEGLSHEADQRVRAPRFSFRRRAALRLGNPVRERQMRHPRQPAMRPHQSFSGAVALAQSRHLECLAATAIPKYANPRSIGMSQGVLRTGEGGLV
jgi:hypothetical protein